MVMIDHVTRALLSVTRTLGDIAESGLTSYMAVNALESIAHELDQMSTEDRRQFVEVLQRLASKDPDQADWIRAVPDSFGLTMES